MKKKPILIRHTIRTNPKEDGDLIILGDEVVTACYKGFVIAVIEQGYQYNVITEDGRYASWVKPYKTGRHYDIYSVGDIVKAFLKMKFSMED